MNKPKLAELASAWKENLNRETGKHRSADEITAFIMGATCVLMVLDFVKMVDIQIIQKELREILLGR